MDDKQNSDKLKRDIDEMKSRYKTPEEQQKEFDAKPDDGFDGYSLGLNLLVSVLVCTGVGVLFDKFFGTGGLVTALMVAVGFAAGIWQIWKKFKDGE